MPLEPSSRAVWPIFAAVQLTSTRAMVPFPEPGKPGQNGPGPCFRASRLLVARDWLMTDLPSNDTRVKRLARPSASDRVLKGFFFPPLPSGAEKMRQAQSPISRRRSQFDPQYCLPNRDHQRTDKPVPSQGFTIQAKRPGQSSRAFSMGDGSVVMVELSAPSARSQLPWA